MIRMAYTSLYFFCSYASQFPHQIFPFLQFSPLVHPTFIAPSLTVMWSGNCIYNQAFLSLNLSPCPTPSALSCFPCLSPWFLPSLPAPHPLFASLPLSLSFPHSLSFFSPLSYGLSLAPPSGLQSSRHPLLPTLLQCFLKHISFPKLWSPV